ncbi:DUF887-domain-containing protein [Auriscalpium vulgare]|uniref:DUF887-domain-containing protein n=1 Tax=Auriscalpium vulgare TaxID=40419 RepID=A0ACB8R785_9AGAM|nr:DUF887-domain-containing protein [Auriscalpium vulgare]
MTTFTVPDALSSALPHLPPHLPTLLLSVLAFAVLQAFGTPLLVRASLGAGKWATLSRRSRGAWGSHTVSMAHALVILPLALAQMDSAALEHERVFGWDDSAGALFAISSGYFLYDTLASLVYYEGLGFVLHGVSCLCIYALAFRPFLAYFGARFLLWELSTVFLNIHWFIDKTGRTGTRLQLVNGVFLLGSFALSRLVYGTFMSYQFYVAIYAVRARIPPAMFYGVQVGNVLLQGLNWFWFTKMISALRRRFSEPAPAKARNGHVKTS